MFKALRRFLRAVYAPAPSALVQSLQLHVNRDNVSGDETVRVNLRYKVNNADVRRGVVHNGRRHTVIPSYTLPDEVVMNGLLYTHQEIEASYKGLEGTLAPLGHPTLDGTYVSANTAEAINAFHVGAFNRNVERRGNRVFVEKWLDEEYAANTEGGRKLLEALDAGEPIHTSTGIFLHADTSVNGITANGKKYRAAATQMVMDHDAILIGEIGAATPEDGVGLLVNTADIEDAEPLTANEVLSKMSYGNLQRMLSDAANLKWGGADKWVWVEDFDTTTAVVHRDKESSAVDYSIKDGVVQFAEAEKPVTQKTEWVDKNPAVNRILQWVKNQLNSGPDTKPPVEDVPDMDRKELDEALAANAKNQGEALKELFAPIVERLTALETNHKAISDSLTANARAAEADKRKLVAEKLGQGVADVLTGNALDECHAKLVGAAPIIGGFQGNSTTDGFKATELPE